MARWSTILCLLLISIVHSSYADDDCDIEKLETLVREVDAVVDRLKFEDEGEEELKKTIAETNKKLSSAYNLLHGLPEDCKKSSQLVTEFVKDYELFLQCPNAPPIENFLDGYNPEEETFFSEKFNAAKDVTPLSKQAEVYKALARLSFLSNIEMNEKFYHQVKELLPGAEPDVYNNLIETLELIAAKTFRIGDQSKTHPELLLELYAFNRTAGVAAAELIAVDQLGKYSARGLEYIGHIPDLHLRAHAFVSIYTTPGISKTSNSFFFIIPHLQELMNAEGFEDLETDLKQDVHKSYDGTHEEGKKMMNEGEVCMLNNPDKSAVKEHSVYVKRDNAGELSNDWVYQESAEGDVDRKPFYSDPITEQIFIPHDSIIGGFWSNEGAARGKWVPAEGGFECSFNPETYNTYICYNVGKITARPSIIDSVLEGDQQKITEYNSKRKETCAH